MSLGARTRHRGIRSASEREKQSAVHASPPAIGAPSSVTRAEGGRPRDERADEVGVLQPGRDRARRCCRFRTVARSTPPRRLPVETAGEQTWGPDARARSRASSPPFSRSRRWDGRARNRSRRPHLASSARPFADRQVGGSGTGSPPTPRDALRTVAGGSAPATQDRAARSTKTAIAETPRGRVRRARALPVVTLRGGLRGTRPPHPHRRPGDVLDTSSQIFTRGARRR
jgi:hypothetical protein